MSSSQVSVVVRARPEQVYAALVDAAAIARWRVPDGMSAVVHVWEARVGGRFRVSLTYHDPRAAGKTADATDTYAGHFADLVPGERVVEVLAFEVLAFEADDPALASEMTMTTTLRVVDEGTEVTVRHDGVPEAVDPADNETGTRMALANLAALLAR